MFTVVGFFALPHSQDGFNARLLPECSLDDFLSFHPLIGHLMGIARLLSGQLQPIIADYRPGIVVKYLNSVQVSRCSTATIRDPIATQDSQFCKSFDENRENRAMPLTVPLLGRSEKPGIFSRQTLRLGILAVRTRPRNRAEMRETGRLGWGQMDRDRLGGGAGGIRTLDTLLTYTHFPGERLRPLGHRSACSGVPRPSRAWRDPQALARARFVPIWGG